MDNVRKSRKLALDLLEDTKDYEGIVDEKHDHVNMRDIHIDVDLDAGPSTSTDKTNRHTEFIKYGKITFNTTAILHHYPQITNQQSDFSPQKPTKESDLNLPVRMRSDNNNDLKSENKETKITITEDKHKDTDNNNDLALKLNGAVKSDNTIEILKNPVKFTEEKLV